MENELNGPVNRGSLNTLSDNSLQTAGYTVDQIRGIRNYDPDSATVNEKVALSAECVTTSTISGM